MAATISTTIAPAPIRFPYVNPLGEPAVWQTIIPRAELVFSAIDSSITLSGVGDDQRLFVHVDLPESFAYVFIEGSILIQGLDVDAWEANASYRIDSQIGGGLWAFTENSTSVLAQTNGLSASDNFTRTYAIPAFKKIIIPGLASDSGVTRATFNVQNLTTNQAVALGTVFFRFLEFDRNQAQNFAINSPVPVR